MFRPKIVAVGKHEAPGIDLENRRVLVCLKNTFFGSQRGAPRQIQHELQVSEEQFRIYKALYKRTEGYLNSWRNSKEAVEAQLQKMAGKVKKCSEGLMLWSWVSIYLMNV